MSPGMKEMFLVKIKGMRLVCFLPLIFVFWQCATESKVVYSIKGIKKAYATKSSREMRKLEKVILTGDRELASYSLALMGRYLVFLNRKAENSLKVDEKEYLNDVGGFLVTAYEERQDFNLRNLIISNLYFNFARAEGELLAILKANLTNANLTNANVINDEVVSHSLFLAGELYRSKRITEAELANQCLTLLVETSNAEAFVNALNCYRSSPVFSKTALESVVLDDLYKKITLKKILLDS